MTPLASATTLRFLSQVGLTGVLALAHAACSSTSDGQGGQSTSSGTGTSATGSGGAAASSSATGSGSAPSDCTVAATPITLPYGGGAVALSIACTSGGTPTSYLWHGAFADGDTMKAVSGAITATSTFTATATNAHGTSAPASATVTVGAPPDLCSQYAHTIDFDLPIGGASVVTTQLAPFDDTTVLVGKIVVPTGTPTSTSAGHVAVSEYQGPSTARLATLSTLPCDFRGTDTKIPKSDPTGLTNAIQFSEGTTATIFFKIGVGDDQTANLQPGATYYFNVRNYAYDPVPGPSCGVPTCNAIVNLAAAN